MYYYLNNKLFLFKKVFYAFLAAAVFEGMSYAGVISNSEIEMYSYIGSVQMGQVLSGTEVDTMISGTDMERRCYDNNSENIEIVNGYFNWIDYRYPPFQVLFWQHPRYFVKAYPDKTNFTVLYNDSYSNTPSSGYPRIAYWVNNSTTEVVISSSVNLGDGLLYCYEISLPTGTYRYKYIARDSQFKNQYELELSSFVVSMRPTGFENRGPAENFVISAPGVILNWNSVDPEGGQLRHRLYAGTDQGNLSLIYEGSNTSYELQSLERGRQYYWQVESINVYGLSARSPVFTFSTLGKAARTFNYPNPFNPITQKTNIVFDMAENGNVVMSIYTELGDLCCKKTFENLLWGTNELAYDGRDDSGRPLYNGSYVCILDKNYPDRKEIEKCRILIIK